MSSENHRSSIPDAEVAIDIDLVADLLATQHPDLAGRSLTIHADGWDNLIVRCGGDLAVRLPRRRLGAENIRTEIRWLPAIARRLEVPVPAPLRVGEPQDGYPWPWCVVPWIEGHEAGPFDFDRTDAARLGTFLTDLHAIELPPDPPRNPFRGGALEGATAPAMARLDRLETDPELSGRVAHLRTVFRAGLDTPRDVPETWLHGDLHPRNVVMSQGSIGGVIDWGDMCAGDPCTDLAATWLFLDPVHHEVVWDRYEPTEPTIARARAWAVAFGAMLLEAGTGADARLVSSGRAALERVLG